MEICDKTTNNNYGRSLTQLFHNLQKYISLTLLRTLEKLCKKRDHGIVDLQPILTETLKQDSSRHQVWNIGKLYTRNMCIKKEKKQHMWDKGEEKNIHHHISKEYNVRQKWSQDHCTRSEKQYNKTSLHPSKHALPLTSLSLC